jgi:O-methyltransferase
MKITITLRSKFKGFFYFFQLDRFIPINVFIFLAQMAKASRWIRKNSSLQFSDFYSFKIDYSRRYDLYKYIISTQGLNKAIDYIEFGVAQGHSFKWWAEHITDENAHFYGFDTFTGLPEDWGPFKKGEMNNNNNPPVIDGSRHMFYQGLFQQTLVKFLSMYKPEARKVIHMDADIYTATLYVLTLITPILKNGDIIIFDELNVPMHEFKAFGEWVEAFYIKYEVLGSVNNFLQTAIMIG